MHSFFTQDIQKLNTLYSRHQFSFVFLYGRNGTGKTSLVREFCQNKAALFFSAQETEASEQLAAFHRAVQLYLQPPHFPERFTDWNHALSFIGDFSSSHRLVLVLDEFHLIGAHDPSFAEAFAQAVHHSLVPGRTFLILTSSSGSLAQSVLSGEAGEPFSLLSARADLTSVPFYSCRSCFSGFDSYSQLMLYGVTGGLPAYLNRIDPKKSADENILSLFFTSDSLQYQNPLTYLHQELRETQTYNFLLSILSNGETRLADIAQKASIGTNKCAKYLNTLISLGIIRKEFPAAGEIKKKVRYIFADHMLRFWYRFVYPNISAILFGRGRDVFELQVRPHLSDFLQPVFETVCAEYLEKLSDTGQTPFACHHTGSWWTGGTKREPFFRIPLVAADGENAVLGLCHCANQPAGASLLESLQNPPEPFREQTCYFCIFSTSGFKKELAQAAARAKCMAD